MFSTKCIYGWRQDPTLKRIPSYLGNSLQFCLHINTSRSLKDVPSYEVMVFLNVTTCYLIRVRFLRDVLLPTSGLEERSSSEKFVPVFQATHCHIPEDSDLRNIGICYIIFFFAPVCQQSRGCQFVSHIDLSLPFCVLCLRITKIWTLHVDYRCVLQVGIRKKLSGAVQLRVTAHLIKCFFYLGFYTVFPASGKLKI